MIITRKEIGELIYKTIVRENILDRIRRSKQDEVPSHIVDIVRELGRETVKKYGKGTPATKKLAQLPNIFWKTLNKRLHRIHYLVNNTPIWMQSGEEGTPAWFRSGEIKDVDPGKPPYTGESAGTPVGTISWLTDGGIYLNTKYDWYDEENFKKQMKGMSWGRAIQHEMDHVMTSALYKVMGVNRDNLAKQSSAVKTVKSRPKSKRGWSNLLSEEGAELRLLGDWLVANGVGTAEAPFTEESIKALSFFSLIIKYLRKENTNIASLPKGNSITDDRKRDSPVVKYVNKAFDEWTGTGLGFASIGTVARLWRHWLFQRSTAVPIHHNVLEGIGIALDPKTLAARLPEILDEFEGINSLAMDDQPAADPDDSEGLI